MIAQQIKEELNNFKTVRLLLDDGIILVMTLFIGDGGA
jgi:hypothetical protein